MNTVGFLIFGGLALSAPEASAQPAHVSARQLVQVSSIEGVRSPANGYFVIRTTHQVSGCEAGFWLHASDARHGGYFARVNEHATSRPVFVVGDRGQLWPGLTRRGVPDHPAVVIATLPPV